MSDGQYDGRVSKDTVIEPATAAEFWMRSSARTKLSLVLGAFWVLAVLVAIAVTGCRSFSIHYAVFLGVSLGLVALVVILAYRVFGLGFVRLHGALRKTLGYGLVVHYVASALPRVGWENQGLIDERQAVLLYVFALLCLTVGIAFHVAMAYDRSYRPRKPKRGRGEDREPRDRDSRRSDRRSEKKSIGASILSWVDSLAWAICAVLLINIFVFQIYQVPTESMVPVFLAGDRPLAIKFLSGPRLPLTEWRLPFLRQPHRGDVVTIANPRYEENRRVDLYKYLSQVVYMATFSLADISRPAPDGSQRADPLIKRIVGLPGEQLMMVDDVLYRRTREEPEFEPAPGDAENYAQVDLWALPESERRQIQQLPIDGQTRDLLDRWDEVKNTSNPETVATELMDLWRESTATLESAPPELLDEFARTVSGAGFQGLAARLRTLTGGSSGDEDNVVSLGGAAVDDLALSLALASSPDVTLLVERYVADAVDAEAGQSAYERGSHMVNLLVKRNLLARVTRDLELMAGGVTLEAFLSDERRMGLLAEAQELLIYLHQFYDRRNFPAFPAEGFLDSNQYFAMGDNRYNSLDFRNESESYSGRVLDPGDASSVQYPSILDMFPLEKQFIESYAVLRVWPVSRLAVIR